MDGFMSVTLSDETDSKRLESVDTKYADEEEGIWLVPFKPTIPKEISQGIRAANDPKLRAQLKEVFLDVLRSTANVVDAARVCKIPKSLAFKWRADDIEFRTRWDDIVAAEMLPQLEAEAIRRAMNGSDLMLIFMLKAMNREKYDDKAAEKVVSKPSVTIQIRDVDKSLVAIASSNQDMPAIEYGTGKLLDAKKAETGAIDAEFKPIEPSDGSSASAEGVSEK